MTTLPSGTVSLLFSDIEGSTALLKRLGPAYAEALDGQRRVLRRAWAHHGGTELGTEGDSFYVVFPTAEGAVAAAAQGQRELAAFEWPGGEPVRVRMGIHTGSPTLHDGAYVGMDVHRAARMAAAAHGGQVLLSSATAELVMECLPERASLKDLGFHQLKDIAKPEHLFQLAIDGLPAIFPSPKTLGTTSSLPRPPTPLVGRDGELAELTALLSSPQVRLVTLTGPGGSGKTRLAIGVAEGLADRFPDGVYFVPLAAVTSADVMWISIAEVLGLPAEGRTTSALFEHVANHRALFVLDNLEQIEDADKAVAELQDHGSDLVVVVTSRRPLNVPGEHIHAVPPLEVPEVASLEEAQRSGAVQMFVQHARMAKGTFALSTANAGDVAALCQRLDGLPLALELAAARTRVLSPAALLNRLDQALDLTASGSLVTARQKTLRDTIAWSYQLLTPTQQAFFRRLGVFVGSADLDAVALITADLLDGADALDSVADLVDASLVTVTDDPFGEPRVRLLETIRSYAVDMLRDAEELDEIQRLHASYYVDLAEQLLPGVFAGQATALTQSRNRLVSEYDNLRAVLTWALEPDNADPAAENRIEIGLKLCLLTCAEEPNFWVDVGYVTEGRQWLERAAAVAEPDSRERAQCLSGIGSVARVQGDTNRANTAIAECVAIYRRLGDKQHLAKALTWQAAIARYTGGDVGLARRAYEEATAPGSDIDQRTLSIALVSFADLEAQEGNYQRSFELYDGGIGMAEELGDDYLIVAGRHNKACGLAQAGYPLKAHALMHSQVPRALKLGSPEFLAVLAEDYGAVLAALDQHQQAARLFGAADSYRQRQHMPRSPSQDHELKAPYQRSQQMLGDAAWSLEYQHGQQTTIEDALTHAHTGMEPANRR